MKSKKVLTILLSLAIMLTFMPTMAFAGTAEWDDADHEWDEGTIVKEYEEGSYGIKEFKCLDENCGATYQALYVPEAPVHEHSFVKEIRSATEVVNAAINSDSNDRMVKWMLNQEGAKDELRDRYSEYCTAEVEVCEGCDLIKARVVLNYRTWGLEVKQDVSGNNPPDINWLDKHADAPADTPHCATSYECEFCGAVLPYEDSDHNHKKPEDTAPCAVSYVCEDCGETIAIPEKDRGPHDMKHVSTTHHVCGAYTIVVNKCKACDYEETTKTLEEGGTVVHTGAGKEVTPPEGKTDYYVQFDDSEGKFYEHSEVVNEPGCETEGTGSLTCADCGAYKECAIEPTGHHLETLVNPATCLTPKTTKKFCTNCEFSEDVKIEGEPLGHDYEVVVEFEPNCYADGITVVKCNRCDGFAIAGANDYPYAEEFNYDYDEENDKYYFTGFQDELEGNDRIEIADWGQVKHDWSSLETMTEATCVDKERQARKCSVCENWDAHNYKEVGEALGHDYEVYQVVDPTCSKDGHVLYECTRCGDIAEDLNDGDYVPALIGEDAVCEGVWVIAKEATPTEDGLKQLVCEVCGAVLSEVPYSYDDSAEKDAALDAAAPVIASADAKLAGNLTDASAKAIKDAKAALETAMANGSAKNIEEKTAALQKAVDGAKAKVANTMTAAAKTVKAKAKKTVKNKTGIVVSNPVGAVSYAKVSGNKKIIVDPVTGKIKVKKGLKKGKKYKVTVAVTAAGDGNTLAKTENVVVKVKVKK